MGSDQNCEGKWGEMGSDQNCCEFPLPKGLKLDTAGESSLGHLS